MGLIDPSDGTKPVGSNVQRFSVKMIETEYSPISYLIETRPCELQQAKLMSNAMRIRQPLHM